MKALGFIFAITFAVSAFAVDTPVHPWAGFSGCYQPVLVNDQPYFGPTAWGRVYEDNVVIGNITCPVGGPADQCTIELVKSLVFELPIKGTLPTRRDRSTTLDEDVFEVLTSGTFTSNANEERYDFHGDYYNQVLKARIHLDRVVTLQVLQSGDLRLTEHSDFGTYPGAWNREYSFVIHRVGDSPDHCGR